jgi:hypothetical protein
LVNKARDLLEIVKAQILRSCLFLVLLGQKSKLETEQISQNKFVNQNDCRDEIMKIRFLLCWTHFKVTLNNITERETLEKSVIFYFSQKNIDSFLPNVSIKR